MPAQTVTVVPTGVANLASVLAALKRAGATPHVATSPGDIRRAARLVLPGVGAFGAALDALATTGLVEPLRARILDGAPLLAICLGMQLLAESSVESPGAFGLGVIAGVAEPFPVTVRSPQLGWNEVSGAATGDGAAYFANSFALRAAPAGWECSWAEHGGRFVAALRRGPQLACQFHPELSGAWGAQLVADWCARC